MSFAYLSHFETKILKRGYQIPKAKSYTDSEIQITIFGAIQFLNNASCIYSKLFFPYLLFCGGICNSILNFGFFFGEFRLMFWDMRVLDLIV